MSSNAKIPTDRTEALHRITDILRCKWAIAILEAIDQGIHRPSDIQRHIPGLSNKVLSERLQRLGDYGLLNRQAFAETPPRVEYTLSTQGKRFRSLINTVADFAETWSGEL